MFGRWSLAVVAGGLVLLALSSPSAATSTATVLAPAAAAPGASVKKPNKYRVCDTWDGVWTISVEDGQGGTNTGQMNVRVFSHERAVGNYSGSTSGVMRGELVDSDGDPKVCGKGWAGTFTDRSGEFRNKGKFRAELYRDNGNWHFFGQYKPCRVFCSWIDWRGSFLEER